MCVCVYHCGLPMSKYIWCFMEHFSVCGFFLLGISHLSCGFKKKREKNGCVRVCFPASANFSQVEADGCLKSYADLDFLCG